MTASIPMNSRISSVLFDTACLMIRSHSTRKYFKDDELEGLVTTSFEEKLLSDIYGVEFFAEIENAFGKGKVKFIVRDADVKVRNELEWTSVFLIGDTPIGLNHSPSRQSPICN